METTKIISFIGMERCDVVNYLTNALKTKKIRTLVIDNSFSHDLFLSLNRSDEEADYLEQGRVIFMRNKCVTIEDTGAFEKFDVVVLYHGLNVNYDMLSMSDYMVLQMDYLPQNLRQLSEMISFEDVRLFPAEKTLYLHRDKGSAKVSEAQIRKFLDLPVPEQESIIYFDEGNYNAYINFLWNGSQETKGVSNEIKSLITALQNWLIGSEKKKKKKGDSAE